MEVLTKTVLLLFAGWCTEDSVNHLLVSNEDFNSHLKYTFYFNDFTLKELMQIFDLNMKLYSKNELLIR